MDFRALERRVLARSGDAVNLVYHCIYVKARNEEALLLASNAIHFKSSYYFVIF